MPSTAPSLFPRRRFGWRIGAAVAALALAGLWSAGWSIFAHLASGGLEDWIRAEAAAGRRWTCPGRSVDGYPFALVVHCERPSFAGEIAGHPASGLVETLSARVGIDHPASVVLSLRGPLYLRGEDRSFDLVVSWEAMTVTVPGVLSQPEGGVIDATRLAVTLATPDSPNANLRAAHLSGEAAAADQPGARSFSFSAIGVSLPTLDPIPGLDGPVTLAGQGVLSRADLLQEPTARRLDAWRVAGGLLRLERFSARQGPFAGTATGTLGLDAAHRVAGHLDTSLAGFGPIAQHLGIPLAGVQIGGLLANLLGGTKAPATEPGTVQLPLTLADGHLAVGPFTTGVRLLPIY